MTFLIRFKLGEEVLEYPADLKVNPHGSSSNILGKAREFLSSTVKKAVLLRVKSDPGMKPDPDAWKQLSKQTGRAHR